MKTDITLLLDRSGSMASIHSATIIGVNTFIKEQQLLEGECHFSLTKFSNDYESSIVAEDIHKIRFLTRDNFIPYGTTALFDAIGRSIDETGKRLSKINSSQQPNVVIFVIVTDGMENSSTEFTKEQIAEIIKHQQEKYSWQFLYLGANQDAFTVSEGLHIGAGQTMSFAASSIGTQAMFSSASSTVSQARGGNTNASFNPNDQKLQDDLIGKDVPRTSN